MHHFWNNLGRGTVLAAACTSASALAAEEPARHGSPSPLGLLGGPGREAQRRGAEQLAHRGAAVGEEKDARGESFHVVTWSGGDAGLELLLPIADLRWIDLDRSQVSDAGLAKLAALEQLEVVKLGQTRVTDAGLAQFARLKNLEGLALQDTRITGRGSHSWPA